MTTADLFGALDDLGLPPGLRYEPQLITPGEEATLVGLISSLPFEALQFHRFTGKRRVMSFGRKYTSPPSGWKRSSQFPSSYRRYEPKPDGSRASVRTHW